MEPEYVWIVHNNCTRNCSHCFCSSSEAVDATATEELIGGLERLGIDYRIYATDQMDDRLADVYEKINDNTLIAGHRANNDLIGLRPDIDMLYFSIHGPDSETHELISPEDDFDTVVANMKEVRRERDGVNIGMFSVVHGKNYTRLRETCELARELGVRRIFFVKLAWGGRARSLPEDFFLSREQIVQWLGAFNKLKYRFPPIQMTLTDNWGPQHSRFKQLFLRIYGKFGVKDFCKCGTEHVTIKAGSNEIYPCKFVTTDPALKMGHFDLEKGLVMTGNWFENLADNIGEPCKSCRIFPACSGGCRGEAIFDRKRRDGVVDYYAGFTECAVALGATKWIDLREDIPAVARGLKKLIPGLAGRRQETESAELLRQK